MGTFDTMSTWFDKMCCCVSGDEPDAQTRPRVTIIEDEEDFSIEAMIEAPERFSEAEPFENLEETPVRVSEEDWEDPEVYGEKPAMSSTVVKNEGKVLTRKFSDLRKGSLKGPSGETSGSTPSLSYKMVIDKIQQAQKLTGKVSPDFQ